MRNSYRFAVILPGWSGHKLPSESSVKRKQTTEHETAQTSNTGGSITVMSHLPPLTYALSVHSFCELRSQRKTTTLSSSLAAALCWLHDLRITIKTTTLSSSLAAAHCGLHDLLITIKTTTLSSSLAAALCWLHDLLITIKTTTLSSSLAAAHCGLHHLLITITL